MKELMIFLYNNCDVVAISRVPIDTSVTGAYYRNFFQNVLWPKICKLSPGMMESSVVILHNDVHLHTGAPAIEILEKYGWEWLHAMAYGPDLSPLDFDLFPKLKEPL